MNCFVNRRPWTALVISGSLLAAPFLLHADVDAESFKQLQSEVAALTESRDTLSGELRKLREEFSALRSENTDLKQRLTSSMSREYASRDDLRKVVEELREVDKRRAADAALVREKLEELARQLSKPIIVPTDPVPANHSGGGTKRPGDETQLPAEFYEYVMKEGDILSVVISEYNQSQGLKVRLSHVLKANPNIKDANRVPVGTKVKIPIIK